MRVCVTYIRGMIHSRRILPAVFSFVMLLAVSCGTRREVLRTTHTTGTTLAVDSLMVQSMLSRLRRNTLDFGLKYDLDIKWTLAPDSVTPVPEHISMTTTGTVNSVDDYTESRDSSSVSVSETTSETADTLRESERVSGSSAAKKESRTAGLSLILELMVLLVVAVCVLRYLGIVKLRRP